MKSVLLSLLLLSSFVARAEDVIEEFDPYAPNAEQMLNAFDQAYEAETGQSAHLNNSYLELTDSSTCYRQSCAVWANVVRSEQRLYLYVNGQLENTWLVSTGAPGHGTPNFDKHPDGRIYDEYSSHSFPGGDYNGLGNMPYAVFISGGFAIHGTPRGNWSKLGQRASHGCIRVHPDNGYKFNRLVRHYGIENTWITVSE